MTPAAQRGDDAERGSVTMNVIMLFFGLLLVIGLVVDGGAKVSASEKAQHTAEAAARAAASSVDASAVTGQNVVINPATAQQAAQTYITAGGQTGTTTVAGNTVTVTVTSSKPTVFLSAIGITQMTSEATATAELRKEA